MISWIFIILSFVLGYTLGRVDGIIRMILNSNQPLINDNNSFLKAQIKEQKSIDSIKKKVEIDSTTFVTDVTTQGMESLGESIGVTSKINDDISVATNKLAQLKKMKG